MNTNERDALVALLQAAVCPMKANGCDGTQYPVTGSHGDPYGEQCQWCYERKAAIEALAAPAEGDGAVARFTPSDADRHRCDNCGLRITDHVPAEEGARCKREAVRKLREILRPAATAVVLDGLAPDDGETLALLESRSDALSRDAADLILRLAAPAAPKGVVITDEMVKRAMEAFENSKADHSDEGFDQLFRDTLTAALATGEQS